MEQPRVERLGDDELDLIRPLLVDLHLAEQPHYADHPQLSRPEVEGFLPSVRRRFEGENVVLAVKDESRKDRVVAFCWCVLFDPGTGLEGEVAEVYVAEDHRNQRLGDALLRAAIGLFEERGVTLGYVWTRAENQAAVRLYEAAGFQPTTQLILTWYPRDT